ncbi:AsmA family protein [Comamonas endophytica]|uniref:AsmA family protein n=1 Tax=Comamonas endophytica TaxID=2949090 RepID=A0ABY6G9T1_9BURK|nr:MULTISPECIES: AsmA family protein [unclassified Acidovorax]MCD2512009.1 AsmA family protein [Acidovorax sp. D4N7]UYG51789.1 AsmA family protein [Acidovorax sp. 5MLIR]
MNQNDTSDAPTDQPESGKPKPTRHRVLRWVAGIVAVLLALLVAIVLFIINYDLNRAKPWIEQKVSEATGRSFHIAGPLSADWHWPQPLDTGWRRWIPGVTVHAEQLTLGNPVDFATPEAPARAAAGLPALPARKALTVPVPDAATDVTDPKDAAKADPKRHPKPDAKPAVAQAEAKADTPPDAKPAAANTDKGVPASQTAAGERDPAMMASIAHASASLRLWPLLTRHVQIDALALDEPDIVFARREDGKVNWQFERREQSDNPWSFDVGQLRIQQGWLGYLDGPIDLAMRARLSTIDNAPADSPYGLAFALTGSYGKADVTGQGKGGPVLSLREREINYPLQFAARAGSVAATAEGILANPVKLEGLDFDVTLKANSMADLYPLTGLVLPNTPAFETRGHLTGSLEPQKAVWKYEEFRGKVGRSDLAGSLTYTSAKPRPRLEGFMRSEQLRLADLVPVLGTSEAKAERAKATGGKILPDDTFDIGRWNAMDLDLKFDGKKIISSDKLPIDALSTHAVLKNGVLRLDPLRFDVARGKFNTSVMLDSNKKPLAGEIRGTVAGLKLSALFPKVELMEKSLGQVDGALALSAQGNSVAKLLGTSTGEFKLYVRNGTLSATLLDLAGLNVGSIVVAKLFGDEREVQLQCAVADFAVNKGVARARVAKLATPEANVEVTGTIDMGRELFDLNIKPEALKWKFFSLRTPLNVQGPFSSPKVRPEIAPLALRAGAAVVAAAVAPVALALVPITVPAAEDDANCGRLLAAGRAAVQAGPKGANKPARAQ